MVCVKNILRTFKWIFPAVILFFSGTIFLSAFFAQFAVNVQDVNITLNQLKSSDTEFVVSFDPSFTGSGDESYHIASNSICNNYDENLECIEPVPNLCPYIALQPKNEEDTEIGFTQNSSNLQATGFLNSSLDETDKWNLTIKSPCFEGECLSNYDESQNGIPLLKSLKGQTFKCNLL